MKDLQDHIGLLYHLTEITATLDMLLSFARVSNLYNYSKSKILKCEPIVLACKVDNVQFCIKLGSQAYFTVFIEVVSHYCQS